MKTYFILALSILAFSIAYLTIGQAAADKVAATRIEADEKAGVIRFIVEGEVRAVLDASGLHVQGDIGFGGVMTDYGAEGFQSHFTETEDGAHNE